MKNIHLLSTDKPSRLRYNLSNILVLTKEYYGDYGKQVNQHIYITSDEEIKDGDWFIHSSHGTTTLLKCKFTNSKEIIDNEDKSCWLEYSHKIILTTDQDLIDDGVQAIADEFLEWFVKNPSCEWIKTYHVGYVNVYNIIIPKEESTFYTKKCKCIIFEPNCFTGMCKNCGGLPKEEPKTMFESLQEYFKNTSKEKVLEDWNEFQHLDAEGITVKGFLENQKQETLEEAAEKYSENWEEITGLDYENTVPSEINKLDFINGAKWQKEQNKNLYSEEELKRLMFDFYYDMSHKMNVPKNLISENATNVDEWFKQYKKK